MQDPVVQAQMQDAQNKAAEVQRKVTKDETDAVLKAEQQEIDRERIASQERIAGVNAGIKAASDRDKNILTADKNKADATLAGFKAGQEMMRGLNGSV
jgi:membrane protein involved in colicin uptake